jgi:hypothetical protein
LLSNKKKVATPSEAGRDEDIVQPLLKDNGYYIIILFNVI